MKKKWKKNVKKIRVKKWYHKQAEKTTWQNFETPKPPKPAILVPKTSKMGHIGAKNAKKKKKNGTLLITRENGPGEGKKWLKIGFFEGKNGKNGHFEGQKWSKMVKNNYWR